MKKTTVLIICLLTCVSLCLPVYATSLDIHSLYEDCKEINDYAIEMVEKYLAVSDVSGNVQISQGFTIYSEKGGDRFLYFIFRNGEMFARMTISESQNGFNSSFIKDKILLAEYAYSHELPVSVIANEQGCYLIVENQVAIINGASNDLDIAEWKIEGISASQICLTNIAVPSMETRGSSFEAFIDGFPIVANQTQTLAIEGVGTKTIGLCWAACVAAVGKYETGISRSPRTVFSWAYDNLLYLGYYPEGSVKQIRDTLNNLYGLSYVYLTGSMTAAAVMNEMLNDTPIIATIRYLDASGARVGHSVVICGAILSGTEYYYILMDPNEPNTYVTIYVGTASTSNFTYVSNTGTYTVWEARVFR